MRQVSSIVSAGQVLKALTNGAEALERDARDLAKLQQSFKENQRILRESVDRYNLDRIGWVREGLDSRGLTWCTYCAAVIAASEAVLHCTKSKRQRKWGDDGYHFHSTDEFHRACPACHAKAMAQHGWQGEYDPVIKDRESFSVCLGEQREDGYYVREYGLWNKLEDYECKRVVNLPPDLVERLATEWHLPRRVGIVDGKFVIYEPVVPKDSVPS